ncbi:GntR family transcriptional regulator [Corynebacterium aquilae DSM 44791]|uniref:GntR family transcriptional regulator n=2 Tax=Corynebacterium aquilae TaxID=203263 RepID=A0A1L7CFI8_9CORY|nr:GntR family transcriptional regulator [Corynebacterium aquilae DSM 44791]
MSALDTFERPTLKGSAEALIRKALLDGSMRPGEIYSANALSSSLKISNSPVREAMMSLADRGLLEPVRNRGFRVVEMSPKDRQEVYDLRRLIEVEAVQRVAMAGVSEAVGDRLQQLAQRTVDILEQVSEGDIFDYLEADHDFHMYLISQVGNARWTRLVGQLRDQSRINGAYIHLREKGLLMQSAREHLELVDAIIGRDGQRAADVMVRHLEYARP